MALGFSAPQSELYFLLLLFLIFSLKQFGLPLCAKESRRAEFTYFRFPSGKNELLPSNVCISTPVLGSGWSCLDHLSRSWCVGL